MRSMSQSGWHVWLRRVPRCVRAAHDPSAGRLRGDAGVIAVWFSFPAAFALAGVGTVLIISALRRFEWKRVLFLAARELDLGGELRRGLRHRHPSTRREPAGHVDVLEFRVPTASPVSVGEAMWAIRRLLYLFVNPLDFRTPFGPRLSALIALACFLAGCASLKRSDAARPLGWSCPPSCLRLWPGSSTCTRSMGRLILWVVPLLLLPIGEGVWRAIERIKDRRFRAVALVLLFCYPVVIDIVAISESRTPGLFGTR